jgi:hypothetical protein
LSLDAVAPDAMTRNRPAVAAAVAVLSVTVPAVATADGSTALEPTVEDRDGGVAVIVTGDGSAVAGTTVTVRPSTASSPVTTANPSTRRFARLPVRLSVPGTDATGDPGRV